jgi:hypothetical protein
MRPLDFKNRIVTFRPNRAEENWLLIRSAASHCPISDGDRNVIGVRDE